MNPRSLRRRLLTGGALALLTTGVLAAVPAGAASAETPLAPGCLTAEVQQTSWAGGATAGGTHTDVTIRNSCAQPVDGWTLSLRLAAGHTLTQGWNADWNASGERLTATPATWNVRVAAGGSTVIGYVGSWTGAPEAPLSCTINGAPCDGGEPGQPPPVSLSSPAEGESIMPPCPIPLVAEAGEGTARVEFYVNDQLVGTVAEAPYRMELPGNHPALQYLPSNTAYARAIAGDGAAADSPTATFHLSPTPPALMVIACTENLVLAPGESAEVTVARACEQWPGLEADVTGDAGINVSPERLPGGEGRRALTVTAAPDSAGAVATIRVRAEDNSCMPATVRVSVTGAELPEVTLTAPTPGAGYPSTCPVTMAADVSAPAGVEIDRVEFLVNDEVVGAAYDRPYRVHAFEHTANSSRPSTGYARAYVSGGGVVESAPATFQLLNPPPALMVLLCGAPREIVAGSSVDFAVSSSCGPGVAYSLSITGDPAITLSPTSVPADEPRTLVVISAAPDSAGATATVEVSTPDCGTRSFPVTVV